MIDMQLKTRVLIKKLHFLKSGKRGSCILIIAMKEMWLSIYLNKNEQTKQNLDLILKYTVEYSFTSV